MSSATLRRPRKTHPYYNYDKLYSFNGTYNFLAGARGLGKTYGAKKKAIRKFLNTGEQFIYLRRYKPELATARRTFFEDLIAHNEFPGYDFQAQGNEAQIAPTETRDQKKRPWKTMGYFVALSTSQSQKSVAFPMVTTIIFDEFIIERGLTHYLPDESDVFNNFYSTVDRYQDKTKVLFLANAVSIMNPYFMTFDIEPQPDEEFIIKADGFVVCHFPEAAAFASSVYETRFGKFIQNSEYAKYAVENTFDDNKKSLIDVKDGRARYQFTLETKRGTFSVWHNLFTNEYFIQEKLPRQQQIFTLLPERMDTDKTLLVFADQPLQVLRTAFRTARISFDKPSTRNSFVEIFKR